MDEATKAQLRAIPTCRTRAGPRDGDEWIERLKEEYTSIISFAQNNKENGSEWFKIESNESGTKWFGKCWHFHNMIKYEFDFEFDIPITYPTTAPEIAIPELDGKTAKMYRGGKICLSDHFKPLWARNVPRFGISHAFSLGLGPWLAVEIPDLVEKGAVKPATTTGSARISLQLFRTHRGLMNSQTLNPSPPRMKLSGAVPREVARGKHPPPGDEL